MVDKSIFASFNKRLDNNVDYIIRMHIRMETQSEGFSSNIGILTATSKDANAIVIDENPVFGQFYW